MNSLILVAVCPEGEVNDHLSVDTVPPGKNQDFLKNNNFISLSIKSSITNTNLCKYELLE